jgi:5-methyltetrahydrofolate--homocysteine methyltransferase
MSIDSSNTEILKAGLAACDKSRGKPMLNSVSLERLKGIELAAEFNAVVIASASGEGDLPTTPEGRLVNMEKLMPKLRGAGLKLADIHIDPLVFPIATDGNNGKSFLDSVSALRNKYGKEIHFVAGLSNISFGMPNRKLITQVFTRLAVEAGADGGIVDPFQINLDVLNSMNTESESFKLAKALLLGEDEFGMNFIEASREGKI